MGLSIFKSNHYIPFYYHFFVSYIFQGFLASFMVIYIVIDYMSINSSPWKKYSSSIMLSLGLIMVFFSPYWYNPMHISSEPSYISYKNLNNEWQKYYSQEGKYPTSSELVQIIQNNSQLSASVKTDILQNINEWDELLHSNNPTAVFWAPLNKIMMYLNLFIVGIIIFLLSIMFYYDKPYYPYIDKLMTAFAIFFVLEAFHSYAASNVLFIKSYREMVTIGQYFTVGILLAFIYLYHLNLRFIISPVAFYYQETIKISPQKVTRWRDEIDTFVLKYFNNKIGWGKRIAQTDNIQ
ncbi:MAG: hypothetical protein HY964_06640 [Ignavibacteriales bacterium]|nr:hypothetical protein [Ignavibacteriales bacterium]